MNRTYTIVFFFTILVQVLFAQSPMVTYVWSFESSHNDFLDQAQWISESFEDEILEHKELYVLVERDNLAEVKEHEKLNKKLSGDQVQRVSVSEGSPLQPGAYFGGKLEYDEGSGEFRVTVNLTSVSGTAQKMRKAQVSIPKGLINDHNSRKEAVNQLFKELHLEERKETSENVFSWFDTYVYKAKELRNQIQEMSSWLPLKSDKSAMEQYNGKVALFAEKILDYNKSIDALLNDKTMIINNFCLYWEGDACKEYGRLLDRIIGFHDRLLNDDSNDIIQLINQYSAATKGKDIKQLLPQIMDSRDEILDDFSRDFTEVEFSIRDFRDLVDEQLDS